MRLVESNLTEQKGEKDRFNSLQVRLVVEFLPKKLVIISCFNSLQVRLVAAAKNQTPLQVAGFNSLQVRLVEGSLNQGKRFHLSFNSLQVRLVVSARIADSSAVFVSIPYRCD